MKAIITYHSVDSTGSIVSIHPATFEQHVKWLVAAQVPVRSIHELLDPACKEGLALTFDDAFENFSTVAWPLLREHDLSATVFVPTSWVGRSNGWDPADRRIPPQPIMDWEALGEVAGQGAVIGSHGVTHEDLNELDAARLSEEVHGSRAALEAHLGVVPTLFSYPYGRYDQRSVEAVRDAGYDAAVTTDLRLLAPTARNRFALPRLDAYYLTRPGALEAWGTNRFKRRMRVKAGARSLRSALQRAGLPL